MTKMRVHEAAKELKMDNKDLIKVLTDMKVEVKTHMSSISQEDFDKVKRNKTTSGVSKVDSKPANQSVSEEKLNTAPVTNSRPNNNQNRPSGDRPNNNQNRPSGDRPSYNQNRPQGDRPNYNQNRPQGDRPNYNQNRPAGDRPNYNQNRPAGDRPNYNQNRPAGDRPNNGQNRPYNNNNGENRPYNNNNGQGGYNRNNNGESRPYNNNNGQGGNRTYNNGTGGNGGYNGNRSNNGENRTYNNNGTGGYNRNNNGESRPYNNNGQGGNRPYNNNGQGGNRPYNNNGQGGYNNNRNNFMDKDKDSDYNKNRPSAKPAAKAATGDKVERNEKVERNQKFEKANKHKNNGKFDKPDGDKAAIKGKGKNYQAVDLSKQTGNKQNRGNKRKLKAQRLLAKEVEVEIEDEDAIKLIQIGNSTNVQDLSAKTGKSMTELIMGFMKMGVMVNKNQSIDLDTATKLLVTYDILVEREEEKDLLEEAFVEEIENEENLEKKERPPVVVVMGHVDHGKTSLLDAIKNSNVIKGEAGGITQHIGAYKVKANGKPITFLDTPGHEAFTAMRMRGAQITDIAVLVVAADDGVMPQTIEAINHAKNAGVQIIVAINKIDKPAANPDRVKQELTEHGILVEEWGGDLVACNVSALKNEGIDNLLDMILLSAEVQQLEATYENKARGTVIEAYLHKGRGPVSHILVQSGTLKVGDSIVAGGAYGKVRAMTDERGNRLKVATPSTPVEILGLSEAPKAGDMFFVANSDKQARQLAEQVKAKGRIDMISETPQKVSLDDLFNQIQLGNIKDLNIIIKGDVQGSVEAVRASLEKLSNEEVRVRPIHCAVGTVTESDITLASASNAIVIAFNVKTEVGALNLAEEQKIDVRNYQIIYKAIEDIEVAMKGMLAPVYEKQVQGHAEIRQIFKASSIGTIGGSMVTSGKITRNCLVIVTRDEEVVFEGKLSTLKRFKDDVKEVAKGYECGLLFDGFNDIKEGDQVEAYLMVEKPRD